jgi:hypothetical protein
MVSAIIRTDVWYRLPTWQLYLSAAVLLVAGIAVAVLALHALARRLPVWGWTWLGAGFIGFTLSTQVVLGELADETALSLSTAAEAALALTFFLAGLVLLILAALRGWAQAGLFTMAAAATMGLGLVQSLTAAPFNRDDLALLAGPLGLLFGLFLYYYIRRPGSTRLILLACVALLNGGIVLLTTRALASWFASRGAVSPVLPLLFLITGLLLSGPLSGWAMKSLRRI